MSLFTLDLSSIVPEKLKPVAKAVGIVLVGVVAILLQLTVIDTNTAAELTTAITTVIGALVVHQTTNSG